MKVAPPRGPWAWRTIVAIGLIGGAAAFLGMNTPDTLEPKIAIDAADFSVAEAQRTVDAVRERIEALTPEQVTRLEPALLEEFTLLDSLVAPDVPRGLGVVAFGFLLPVAIGLFGAFILRRSGNAFGWWIVVGALIGAMQGVGVAGTEYLTRADAAPALVLPFSLIGGSGWIALGVVYFPNLLATFPNGRVLSPRWRWLWITTAASAAMLMVHAIGPLFALDTRVNPIRLLSADTALFVFNLGILMWGVSLVASVAALVARFIRSEGEERLQLKWVAVGAVFALIALGVGNLMQEGDFPDAVAGAVAVVPIFLILPVILIITVFRHRLYDVDVVINKSVMVAILATAITGIYAGVIYGVGAILGGDEISFDLQVMAAVLVAMAFHPIRRRAQQFANRLVYGHRATPYEVLARFSHRAAETPDEQVLRRIPRLVVDGVGAVESTLWVMDGDRFVAAASWPESVDRAPIRGGVDAFVDEGADASLSIRNSGDLLGGISLIKARGESMTPADQQLLADLASGLGVVMRNNALTTELREQVTALAASRDRVVAAADEARRALERDLDSGPQQRLVAVKVMLGPIRKQAEQAGATQTAQVLEQLEVEAGDAIRSVRDFAGGIYPPLLEAEGVGAAITQHAQRAPFPVDIEIDGIGRYPREMEAAIYFTVLEALQNAAKYADPTRATVAVREDASGIEFEVSDDGSGFDRASIDEGRGLSNMEDRIDSIGGRLRIDSAAGEGTRVRGAVPVPTLENAY